jgi:hypothetical protein
VARILKSGALYFALVFAAGFVLGALRVLWVLPRLGERAAELMEMPLMLAVAFLAARWIVRRSTPASPGTCLGIGLFALGLLLAAEVALVLGLRGLSVQGYLASRDPVAGTAFVVALALFALMPLLVARK